MIHEDHVNLLRKGILEPGGVWADLGSGAGAFTLALADLIGSTGEIYSVDKDAFPPRPFIILPPILQVSSIYRRLMA